MIETICPKRGVEFTDYTGISEQTAMQHSIETREMLEEFQDVCLAQQEDIIALLISINMQLGGLK